MKSLKVMTIVGTRPEVIKLSRVIAELEKFTDHILVHTGQNHDYELNEIFFQDLEIRKPDYFLSAAGKNAAETIGKVIIESDKILEKIKPDALLIYGDTNSCLSAISAKRRKIPVFHMEAGNRCFDQRVPEEINRKIIDHISDVNLTLSEHARRYLIAEGLKPETVIKTGSSMKEVINHNMEKIKKSPILENLELSASSYFVVSAHREENVDSQKNLSMFLKTLNSVADKWQKKIVVSTHPRTRKQIDIFQENNSLLLHPLILLMKPFGFLDYAKLQMESFCVLSDSGSLTEDASLLDFPAIAIRQTHERPEGMDAATLIMSSFNPNRINAAIEVATTHHIRGQKAFTEIADYAVENLSKKIVRIIMSYVDYINRTVWQMAEA